MERCNIDTRDADLRSGSQNDNFREFLAQEYTRTISNFFRQVFHQIRSNQDLFALIIFSMPGQSYIFN